MSRGGATWVLRSGTTSRLVASLEDRRGNLTREGTNKGRAEERGRGGRGGKSFLKKWPREVEKRWKEPAPSGSEVRFSSAVFRPLISARRWLDVDKRFLDGRVDVDIKQSLSIRGPERSSQKLCRLLWLACSNPIDYRTGRATINRRRRYPAGHAFRRSFDVDIKNCSTVQYRFVLPGLSCGSIVGPSGFEDLCCLGTLRWSVLVCFECERSWYASE